MFHFNVIVDYISAILLLYLYISTLWLIIFSNYIALFIYFNIMVDYIQQFHCFIHIILINFLTYYSFTFYMTSVAHNFFTINSKHFFSLEIWHRNISLYSTRSMEHIILLPVVPSCGGLGG